MLAWPTLWTASVSGTCAGSAARARAVRTCLCGTTRIASSPAGTSKRAARASDADDEAAEQRRGGVVGVALELGRRGQQRRVELEHRVGRHQPGHVGRRARAEAARERHVGADRELEVVRRVQRLEARARRGCAGRARSARSVWTAKRPVSSTSSSTCRAERGGEDVEARPEVGRGSRHPHQPPALCIRSRRARPRRCRARTARRSRRARARSPGP